MRGKKGKLSAQVDSPIKDLQTCNKIKITKTITEFNALNIFCKQCFNTRSNLFIPNNAQVPIGVPSLDSSPRAKSRSKNSLEEAD